MQVQDRHSDTLCLLCGAGKVWKIEVSSYCSTIRAVYHNCGLVLWLPPARHAQFQGGSTKYCLEIWLKELISQKLAWENHVSARVCPRGQQRSSEGWGQSMTQILCWWWSWDRKQPREIIHRPGSHSSERAPDLFEAGQLNISLSSTGNHPQPFRSPEVLI